MNIINDKELLQKFCRNACQEKELSSVLEWFERSAKSSEGKALLYKIWDELPDENDNLKINFDLLLDKIHHEVNVNQSKKLLKIANHNIIKYKRKVTFIKFLTRAAAILMIPVLGFGLHMSIKYQLAKHDHIRENQSYSEVFSSVDAITKVSLQDGSSVWLNHSSTLKYPTIFQGDFRMVELIGEGYFEVAHNQKVPFIVKVGDLQVMARGTTFNIRAYPDDDRIETSLINGQVELRRQELNGNVFPLITMKPTDLAIFNKSNNDISTRTIYDDRYFSWKDGKLVFNKEPMGEVAKKLSRWFNVDIQIKDPELLDLTFTATFIHETLPQVMELLGIASPVNYSISNREEIGDGTYSKRKITLSYRKK